MVVFFHCLLLLFKMSEFNRIISSLASDIYPFTKYKSERTGLIVVITQVEVPVVECAILIVTEPENDSGCIHALEHLILNGSEEYPQKDVLSKLADNVRCWSDIDHTILNFSTAGHQCALALIPIFLDHVMYPLLSEEDFILDVHHVDGEGKDGGLVYEEIASPEGATFYNRLESKFLREMCPNSGYSYDYRGTEEELRGSTNSKVKEFHKKYYRPENITVVLTGHLIDTEVLKTISKFEDKIIAKRITEPVEEWVKPWQTIPSAPNYGEHDSFYVLPIDKHDHVASDCHMIIGWRGPVLSIASSRKDLAACEILLDYLTGLPSAPLKQRLVETGLSGVVSFNIDANKVSLLRLEIFDVAEDNVKEAQRTALGYLRGISNQEINLDLENIQNLVQKELTAETREPHHDITLQCLSSSYLESEKHTEEHEFVEIMNPQWHLKKLLQEDKQYWLDTFKKYFTDDIVVVTSRPMKNVEINEENMRKFEQVTALGKLGLAEKAKLLDDAKGYRERQLQYNTNTLY